MIACFIQYWGAYPLVAGLLLPAILSLFMGKASFNHYRACFFISLIASIISFFSIGQVQGEFAGLFVKGHFEDEVRLYHNEGPTSEEHITSFRADEKGDQQTIDAIGKYLLALLAICPLITYWRWVAVKDA